jgi:hypothetical protein
MNSPIAKLILPRYVPFVLKGTVLAVWYDSREEKYVVVCPKCHTLITYDSLDAIYHEMVCRDRQCCQGCRARITLEKDPGLTGLFLDFWYRTGKFPESDSWLEAIPQPQLNFWAKEIKAALKTDHPEVVK